MNLLRKCRSVIFFIGMILLLSILFYNLVFSAGPGTITYQGTVTKPGGNPPTNGNYAMRFALWDLEGGGDAGTHRLWQEAHTNVNAVTVTNGTFSVELGSITPFPDNFFQDNANLWLEVEIDLTGTSGSGFEVFSPRVVFSATPYAFHSDTASYAQSSLKNTIRNFVVETGETISAGDIVSLLNNGKVKKGLGSSYSSEFIFNSASTSFISAAKLSETKFVIAYKDIGNLEHGTVIVGDISGSTITFGSEVEFNKAITDHISIAALSSTKFVIAYRNGDNSYYGTAKIGTVTGNTINFAGSPALFYAAPVGFLSVSALSDTKFVVCFMTALGGTARIGIVSGSSIDFSGPTALFNSAATTAYISSAPLLSTKFVVAYQDYDNFHYGTAVVGDVSGNSISFGSEYIFNNTTTTYVSVAALSSVKVIITYRDEGNFYYGTGIIGNVSGNSIFYGPEYIFNSAGTQYISSSTLSSTKFVVAYSDNGNYNYGSVYIGNVSGNAITLSNKNVFNGADTNSISIASVSVTNFVITYMDEGNHSGNATMGVDLTEESYPLGIADANASSGENVPIIINGISDNHSGLVIGKLYYANTDGTLTKNPTPVKAGLAISPTELLLDIQR